MVNLQMQAEQEHAAVISLSRSAVKLQWHFLLYWHEQQRRLDFDNATLLKV